MSGDHCANCEESYRTGLSSEYIRGRMDERRDVVAFLRSEADEWTSEKTILDCGSKKARRVRFGRAAECLEQAKTIELGEHLEEPAK